MYRLCFSVAAVFWWGLFFAPLAATDFKNSRLDEIIVTGTHTPLTFSQVGSAYTVITADDIAKRQAVRIADILREVPGFSVSGFGGAGGMVNIRVRGAEANHLLVLVDGIKANDVAGSDQFDFAHFLTDNIERIEIIRGPQSALYGSDALAGVIHIITKSGSPETTMSGLLEKGTYGSFHGRAGLSGAGARYQYNLQAAYLSSTGNNISLTGGEDDGYDNRTGSFKISLTPFNDLRIEAVGRRIDSDTETDGFANGAAQDADNHSEVIQNYFAVRTVLHLLDGRWQQRIGGALIDTDNANFVANGLQDVSTQGEKLRFDYQSTIHFDMPAIWNMPHAHALTVGIDHEKDRFTQTGDLTVFGDPNQRRRATTTGWVAGYQTRFGERLSLSASIRHDNYSLFKNAHTYRFTAAAQPGKSNVHLHASFGTGIKRPTFTERFGFFTNFIGNPDLKPERSRSWDLGIRHTFWQDKAMFDITYFSAKLEDRINGFVFSGTGFTAENLSGISRREGVEFSGNAMLSDDLTLAFNYTWLNASDAGGNQVVRRPRHQANARMHYQFLNDRASVNFGVNYIGERTDTNFTSFNTVVLNGDWLLDIVAAYQLTEHTQIYAKIDNPLDQNYSSIYGYNTPGTYAGIGIKATFQP